MAKYSDWRTDLREVMDDDVDEKQVKEKKVNNNKLIKINPKLGEAVEEIGGQILEMKEVDDANKDETIEKDADAEKKAAMADKVKKKEAMLKKRIVRMKMMAVNQGAADSIVAGYEPEGEMVEGHQRDPEQSKKDRTHSKQPDPSKDGFTGIGNMSIKDIMKMNARMKKEEVIHERTLSSYIPSDRKGEAHRANLDYTKAQLKKKEDESTKNRGDLSKRDAGKMAKERLRTKKISSLGEEVVTERLGGKGYSKQAAASSVYPGKKGTGDWEDSDRGAGNKAARRAGKKVEKKSPTYRAYVLNKEDYETKKTGEVLAAFKRDPKVRKRFEKAAKKEEGPGSVKNRAADSMLQTAKDTAKRKGDTSKSDDRYAYEEVVYNEGVMKFIKDRVGSKKKSEKKAEMDKTTEKLHDLRREKFKTDKQKEHEKYVNFLPVDEEVVTELNRYGKETGKATGSLNKRPGSPVATRNEPGSAVNVVRRMIRKDTGRPEGQQKKVKGAKGLAQPGDRRFTPAQTISRMRAQVAAADAAMRDTRGT